MSTLDKAAQRAVEGRAVEDTAVPDLSVILPEPVWVGVDMGEAAGDRSVSWTPGSHYRNPRSLNFYDWPSANDNAPTGKHHVPPRSAFPSCDYISTHTGRFYPMSPRASEVNILDIAHSLSMQCRYAGHGYQFYSVAEHSVHIARYVSAPNKLAALLHDATEAYLVDVPRPVKRALHGYKAAEERVWMAIAAAFGLSPLLPEEVHEADSRIIADEMGANMHECDPAYDDPLGVTLEFWTPAEAEREFLALYRELIEERKVAA